jgi:hypothetical protein
MTDPIVPYRLADLPAPPLHNLLVDHSDGCPPQCQHHQWTEQRREASHGQDD